MTRNAGNHMRTSLKFVDTDGDGKITEKDKTYIGDPIADMTMGLNLGFNYKNIDFSASAFASLGNDMVRDYERKNLYSNKGTYVLDSWTTSNPSNTTPKAVNGGSINYDNFSDYFVEDASYLKNPKHSSWLYPWRKNFQ